jgi:hypothetical protein
MWVEARPVLVARSIRAVIKTSMERQPKAKLEYRAKQIAEAARF